MSTLPSGMFSSGNPLTYRSTADDATLSRFFNAVYAWMCVGLAVTAVASYGAFLYARQLPILASPVTGLVLFFIALALAGTVSSATQRISTPVATALFLAFAALMGVMLSTLYFRYSSSSLATAFLETAGTFGVMSIYGLVTRRDLSRLGSLLGMLLIGIVIASVVNFFMHSAMLYWIVSLVGVVVFVGLTACDTQRLKQIAEATQNDPRLAGRMAIVGSLTLYLDFINLFLFILQAFGDRRQD
jgi:FtsH-binding integral membrane protein